MYPRTLIVIKIQLKLNTGLSSRRLKKYMLNSSNLEKSETLFRYQKYTHLTLTIMASLLGLMESPHNRKKNHGKLTEMTLISILTTDTTKSHGASMPRMLLIERLRLKHCPNSKSINVSCKITIKKVQRTLLILTSICPSSLAG